MTRPSLRPPLIGLMAAQTTWSKQGDDMPNRPEAIIQPAESFHWTGKDEEKVIVNGTDAPTKDPMAMEVDAAPSGTAATTSDGLTNSSTPSQAQEQEVQEAATSAMLRKVIAHHKIVGPSRAPSMRNRRKRGPRRGRSRSSSSSSSSSNSSSASYCSVKSNKKARTWRRTRSPTRPKHQSPIRVPPGVWIAKALLRASCRARARQLPDASLSSGRF